ncbi:unnamed protein product, partial [Choristocarpus tenellus]
MVATAVANLETKVALWEGNVKSSSKEVHELNLVSHVTESGLGQGSDSGPISSKQIVQRLNALSTILDAHERPKHAVSVQGVYAAGGGQQDQR